MIPEESVPPADLDPNKVIAEFLSQNIGRYERHFASFLSKAVTEAKLLLKGKYTTYLKRITDKHLTVRTFFHKDSPIKLYQVYEPLDVMIAVNSFSTKDRQVANAVNLEKYKFAVIVGSGGSGKTTIMRHLLLDAMQYTSRIPVLFELRDLGETLDLEPALLKSMHDLGLDHGDEYLHKWISKGDFIFLLDGFDEITPQRQAEIALQINSFQSKYSENLIVVSSRPDHVLSVWQAATTLHVSPLTLPKAVSLIDKIPYDRDITASFSQALAESLFKQHESFLSNPLLLTIMLLTYGENADIPKQVTAFYNQAFEALFQKHDATKGVFKRTHKTKLNMQEYRKAFAAFSIYLYSHSKIHFTRFEALDAAAKAKELSDLDFDEDNFLDDGLQAVCLLVEDGQTVTFTHRSLQEYFAAVFVDAFMGREKTREIFDRFSKRISRDNFFSHLLEINPRLVDLEFTVPFISQFKIMLNCQESFTKKHLQRFLQLTLESANVFVSKDRLKIRFSSGTIQRDSPIEMLDCLSFFHLKYDLRKIEEGFNDNAAEIIKFSSFENLTPDELDLFWVADHSIFGKSFLSSLLKLEAKLIKKWERNNTSIDEILLN